MVRVRTWSPVDSELRKFQLPGLPVDGAYQWPVVLARHQAKRRSVANIVMSAVEWEPEIIGERTSEAVRKSGSPASGWAVRSPCRRPSSSRSAGCGPKGHTLDHIAQVLNADRMPTAHGGARLHSSTLRGVLKRSGGERAWADVA